MDNKDLPFKSYPSFQVAEQQTKCDVVSYEEQKEVSAQSNSLDDGELTRIKREMNSKDEEIRLLKNQLNMREKELNLRNKEIRRLEMIIESAFVDLSRGIKPAKDAFSSKTINAVDHSGTSDEIGTNINPVNDTFVSRIRNPAANGGFDPTNSNSAKLAVSISNEEPPVLRLNGFEVDLIGAMPTV